MRRRTMLALACAALAASFSTEAFSQAQSWPERAVKLILPYAPGGATDLIGRPWADKLCQAFGQQFVIENRGGAGGMIGTEAAAKAPPDGYTFLLTPNATLSVLPTLRKTAYDPDQELRAGGARRRPRLRVRHSSRGRREDLQGDDRVRQEEPRQAGLRLGRPRHRHAAAPRDAEVQGRHRHPARALPRQRRRAQRPAAQQRPDDERDQCRCPTSRPAS